MQIVVICHIPYRINYKERDELYKNKLRRKEKNNDNIVKCAHIAQIRQGGRGF